MVQKLSWPIRMSKVLKSLICIKYFFAYMTIAMQGKLSHQLLLLEMFLKKFFAALLIFLYHSKYVKNCLRASFSAVKVTLEMDKVNALAYKTGTLKLSCCKSNFSFHKIICIDKVIISSMKKCATPKINISIL